MNVQKDLDKFEQKYECIPRSEKSKAQGRVGLAGVHVQEMWVSLWPTSWTRASYVKQLLKRQMLPLVVLAGA